MTDTAVAQHNDTTNRQHSSSSTSDEMVDADDVATGAALVALPQPAATAAGETTAGTRCYQSVSM